ncbi:hypothetical protein HDV02_005152 [Globomyces sp. JEL0801]|nr:hypothetical protein HDV02_005152 [Globomyces sp. JEL0801]
MKNTNSIPTPISTQDRFENWMNDILSPIPLDEFTNSNKPNNPQLNSSSLALNPIPTNQVFTNQSFHSNSLFPQSNFNHRNTGQSNINYIPNDAMNSNILDSVISRTFPGPAVRSKRQPKSHKLSVNTSSIQNHLIFPTIPPSKVGFLPAFDQSMHQNHALISPSNHANSSIHFPQPSIPFPSNQPSHLSSSNPVNYLNPSSNTNSMISNQLMMVQNNRQIMRSRSIPNNSTLMTFNSQLLPVNNPQKLTTNGIQMSSIIAPNTDNRTLMINDGFHLHSSNSLQLPLVTKMNNSITNHVYSSQQSHSTIISPLISPNPTNSNNFKPYGINTTSISPTSTDTHSLASSPIHRSHSRQSQQSQSTTETQKPKQTTKVPIDPKSPPSIYKCSVEQCGKEYSSKYTLKIHIQSAHEQNRTRYPCTFSTCTKTFSRKQDMYRHVKLHTDGRRFTCERCDRKFTRREHLGNHTRSGKCVKKVE